MSQSRDRHHEPIGLRFERRISQLERDREAEAEARKEAKVKALQQDVMLDLEGKRAVLPSQSVTSNSSKELSGRYRRPKVEDEDKDEQLSNEQSNGEPVQTSCVSASAMLTPPLSPHSPDVGNARELDARYPRNTIQTLNSRLEEEERRVTELKQELGRTKAQLEHYIADQNSIHQLQIRAVVANDRDEIARLKEQLAELSILAERSCNDVSRLQEELRQKDRLIDQLRAEIRQKSEELHRTSLPVKAHKDRRRSEHQVRPGCSRLRLERNSDGIRMRKNETILPMANSVAFPFT
ncbi:hypothetical protein GJ744_010329 [Endocarpon pusillum]|uniref:Uncharacterized protein n=1 Tax=Endocarpon pusillum TaxID=364733 RepID=A0A8H7E474_9EURO|nr:hypothetical protein GJ744_010329 [Endocarpon pusillum]